MTGLGERLSEARQKIDFKSDVLKTADKLSKKELNDEVDCRIALMKNPELVQDILGEDKDDILRRVSAEAKVLSLMYLRKYPKGSWH